MIDGAARGNPGLAGCGAVICDEKVLLPNGFAVRLAARPKTARI